MTSMHMDQLVQEDSSPTVPAHTLGDPTEAATRGNIREDTNLDGNSRETKATHGSFTRYLAKLAKLMFTQQGPYRDTKEGDPIDPGTLGEPPGDISATLGSNLATLGSFIQLSAALGNFTRYLASHGEPLPAEDNSYRVPEATCPLYPYHPGNPPGEDLAIHGDSIQTLATYGNSSTDLGGTYRGVTKGIYHLPHFHHLLTISSRHQILPHFTTSFSPPYHPIILTILPRPFHLTNTYHFYHHLITSLHHIFPPSIFHIYLTTITSLHPSSPMASKLGKRSTYLMSSSLINSLHQSTPTAPSLHQYSLISSSQ